MAGEVTISVKERGGERRWEREAERRGGEGGQEAPALSVARWGRRGGEGERERGGRGRKEEEEDSLLDGESIPSSFDEREEGGKWWESVNFSLALSRSSISLSPLLIPQATAFPLLTHLAPFLSLFPRLPALAPGKASSSDSGSNSSTSCNPVDVKGWEEEEEEEVEKRELEGGKGK
jgi:hypothetical protein